MQRDTSIDLARGLAIVTMVWATLAPFALQAPHPLWFRLLGSFAAPLFVFVSGMMLPMATTVRRHSLGYYLKRGGLLVAIAMLIDVAIWRQWPWFSFDVLYLIGIGTPLVFLSLRVPAVPRAIVAVGVMAISPWLRGLIGYPHTPRQPQLRAAADYVFSAMPLLDDHALIGGFFPLLPWLGVMMLGSALGSWRWSAPAPRRLVGRKSVAVALGLLAVGIATWQLDSGPMVVRGGFSEIFYPPTTGYLALAIGLVACALVASDHVGGLRPLEPIRELGRASLFVYWMHVALIGAVVRRWGEPQPFIGFVATYVVLMAVLYGAVKVMQHQRARVARLPLPLRMPLST